MDTLQINDLCLMRYSNFLGCLSIDELKDKNIRTQLCNDFTIGNFVIFNIDEKTKPGRHWVLIHRMSGGNLFFFDSFGAFGSNMAFNFTNFDEAEKHMITSYDEALDGQLFQYSLDNNYKDDFKFENNDTNSLILHKKLLKSYANFNNMSDSLFYLLDFLKLLCPSKSIHNIFYFTSQLQPFNTIVCGELCILVAETLFRDMKVLRNKKANNETLLGLTERIQELFSTAYTPKIFVQLVKQYMLSIDPFYKVKTDNLNYFKEIFSKENTKLIV